VLAIGARALPEIFFPAVPLVAYVATAGVLYSRGKEKIAGAMIATPIIALAIWGIVLFL